MNKTQTNTQDGFTLVELAMVLIIFGMTMSSIMLGMKVYMSDQKREETIEAVEESSTALFTYQIIDDDGYYPCPANPRAAPGDPDYGLEDCTGASLITVPGRDVDNADGDDDIDTGGEPVLIGAFPFATVINKLVDPDGDPNTNDTVQGEFKAGHHMDGWGGKITYAVTRSLSRAVLSDATPQEFDHENGAIFVIDELRNNLTDQPGVAHVVLISHGPNNQGAFSENGDYIGDCVDITKPADVAAYLALSNADERENCDHEDAIAGGPADAEFLKGHRSDVEGNYNDDIVRVVVSNVSNLWEYSGGVYNDNGTQGDPEDDFVILQLTNTNGGDIGIGIDEPQAQLHLEGDLQAIEIHANKLCDSSGGDCMPPEVIGGELPDMQCPTGKVVTKIGENKVHCEDPFALDPSVFTPCPPGEFMTGISNVNGPICSPPP